MEEVEIPKVEEMEEIRTRRFTRRVALTTALFAVALAITSLGANHAMKGMILSQQKASDQWAYYQAKVMREQLLKTQGDLFKALVFEHGKSMPPEVRSHYESRIKEYNSQAQRYEAEKADINREAGKFEHERDIEISKDPYFDYAEVILQISIVMASISILAVSAPVFYFSVSLAVIGVILSFNGFTMLFTIPFLQ
jgi:hypothetical protein